MNLREAAQLTLKALDSVEWYGAGSGWMVDADAIEKSITALKAALLGDTDGHEVARNVQVYRRGWDAGFSAGVAAPVQEPVAWVSKEKSLLSWDKFYPDMTPLYTAPPQRKPLSEEEIWRTYKNLWMFHPAEEPRLAGDVLKFARAIERAHGIGGNDEPA